MKRSLRPLLFLPFIIFLPFVVRSGSPLRNRSGAELSWTPARVDLIQSRLTDRHWKVDVRWDQFEPEKGIYTLPYDVSQRLAILEGAEIYLNFKVTPERYRLWPGMYGSPPAPEYWDECARAIIQLMQMTGINQVELFNEPNFRTSDVPNDVQQHYGAMVGEYESYYMAGYRYGKMLEVISRIIKRDYPQGQLFAGAMAVTDFSINSNTWPFFHGIYDANDGDIPARAVSLHIYVHNHWPASSWDEAFAFVREIGWTADLPVVISETSLLLADNLEETDAFREKQAEWVRRLEREGIAFTWYNFEGYWSWYHSALVRGLQRGDMNVQPTRAYDEWAN